MAKSAPTAQATRSDPSQASSQSRSPSPAPSGHLATWPRRCTRCHLACWAPQLSALSRNLPCSTAFRGSRSPRASAELRGPGCAPHSSPRLCFRFAFSPKRRSAQTLRRRVLGWTTRSPGPPHAGRAGGRAKALRGGVIRRGRSITTSCVLQAWRVLARHIRYRGSVPIIQARTPRFGGGVGI